MNPPSPDNIFVGRPIFQHSTPWHDTGMQEICFDRAFSVGYDHVGESSISTARDYIVHHFLARTSCEWLVWIDADIAFRRRDWQLLMEQQGDELAVCGEYLKKRQDLQPEVANFGLGFARVHRSVYEALDALNNEDGSPRLLRYRASVRLSGEDVMEDFTEFHPIGVTYDGSRRNEDHGFWLMVRLAGLPIRKECRTQLGHSGLFTWWYDSEAIALLRRFEQDAP